MRDAVFYSHETKTIINIINKTYYIITLPLNPLQENACVAKYIVLLCTRHKCV